MRPDIDDIVMVISPRSWSYNPYNYIYIYHYVANFRFLWLSSTCQQLVFSGKHGPDLLIVSQPSSCRVCPKIRVPLKSIKSPRVFIVSFFLFLDTPRISWVIAYHGSINMDPGAIERRPMDDPLTPVRFSAWLHWAMPWLTELTECQWMEIS